MRRISPVTWALIAVGLLFVVLGIVYFTMAAPDLPSFIPGHVEKVKHARKYSKRGIASFVAVLAFGAAYYTGWMRTKSASDSSASSAEPSV